MFAILSSARSDVLVFVLLSFPLSTIVMGGKTLVSVEMCARTGECVSSPRSLEACRRSGIEPDELLPKCVIDSVWLRTRASSSS